MTTSIGSDTSISGMGSCWGLLWSAESQNHVGVSLSRLTVTVVPATVLTLVKTSSWHMGS